MIHSVVITNGGIPGRRIAMSGETFSVKYSRISQSTRGSISQVFYSRIWSGRMGQLRHPTSLSQSLRNLKKNQILLRKNPRLKNPKRRKE